MYAIQQQQKKTMRTLTASGFFSRINLAKKKMKNKMMKVNNEKFTFEFSFCFTPTLRGYYMFVFNVKFYFFQFCFLFFFAFDDYLRD